MKQSIDYQEFLVEECLSASDTAHDLAHIRRVVNMALKLARAENADCEVVEAAAWLHDCVALPKNHPDRHKASALAAQKAEQFLRNTDYPGEKISSVVHAIRAHSFSAGIRPETPEAEIVQDADRLDALGAIGIARCFLVAGQLNRPLYDSEDPFCEQRPPDDSTWTIDHFYQKLLKLPDTMNTESAGIEALKRAAFMREFLSRLKAETGS